MPPTDSTSSSWRLRRRIELSTGSVATDVVGTGPPVVLVHGTPTWSYLWRNLVPPLAREHSVHLFDLLGYGDSPARPGTDISIAGQADLLVQLLDLWELDEPSIAGHDIGGAIVLRAALLHQRRFDRIALLDAVVLRPWITPTTMHIKTHLEAYRTMPLHIYEQVATTHLRTAMADPMPAETFEAYARPWRGERGRAAYLEKVARFDEGQTAEFEPLLTALRPPVRLIWGEQDAWLPPEIAHRLRGLLPRAELSLVPGAGHFCMEDAPEAVARLLVDFFSAAGAARLGPARPAGRLRPAPGLGRSDRHRSPRG